MTQSKFYPLSKHTNIYKLVEQPNSSYQVGKSYVNKPIYYGGFLKNEQLANYAANYLRLEANINVYKVFLEQNKTKQKQIIKHVLGNIQNDIYNILKKEDKNNINNKGNNFVQSNQYNNNIKNIFLNYSYSEQQTAWKKWLKTQALRRKALIRNHNKWLKTGNLGPRMRNAIMLRIASQTNLPNNNF